VGRRIGITNICSFSLFIILILGQFVLFSREVKNRGASWGGDESYYVSKAEYLAKHGVLPKADDIGMALGIKWRGTDHRPPGYPVFIALCNYPEFNIENVRWRCCVAQFVLMSVVLMILYFMACAALKGSKWTYLAALMFGIQPWAFEYSASIYPDSLTASITTLALIGLFMFIKTKKSGLEMFYFLVSILLLCSTFMLRAERILLVPIIAFTAVIIKSRKMKSILKYGCYSGLIFSLFCGMQIGYRHYITGKAELIPKYRWSNDGAVNWVHTWFNTEKSGVEGFAFGSADKRFEKLPPRAFGDELERKEIKRALSLYARSGWSEEADKIFQEVANKRIKDNFFVNYIAPKVWRTGNLWINHETSAQLLNVVQFRPRPVRRLVIGMLSLLRLMIYLLVMTSVWTLWQHFINRNLSRNHYLTVLMLMDIFLITVFFGLVWSFNEHRYVLSAWPAMLWCAASAIIDLSTMFKKRDDEKYHREQPV